MATYYYDSNAATNGDGLTAATPYNTETGTAFGSDTWYLFAGSMWDLGSTRGTTGNNCQIIKYGTGADPIITSSNASGVLNIATTYGCVFDGIEFVKSGAFGGVGINAVTCVNTGQPGTTVRRCTFRNLITAIDGDRCYTLVAEDNVIYGASTTTGIRGRAQLTCPVAANWRILRNTFYTVGVGIRIDMSDSANGAGSFTNLQIVGNTIRGCLGSGLLIGGILNEDDYTYRAALNVTAGPTYTLQRNASDPVWGAVTAGTVIFLSGWGLPTSFGRFSVVSGGGTRALVISPLDGQVPVNDAEGIGRGYFVMDADKCAVGVHVSDNDFDGCGQAPMQIVNVIGGRVAHNRITNTTVDTGNGGFGNTSACIEVQGSLRIMVEANVIDGVTGGGTGDGCGIFLDGGADACIARRNRVSNLVGPNLLSRSGVAIFYARNSKVYSNVIQGCNRGVSMGGNVPGTDVFNNTFDGNYYGAYANSSPGANGNTVTIRNNLITNNTVGISDDSDLDVSTNAWWQNATDNAAGALSSKDASAITSDPKVTAGYRPLPGSPLLGAGTHVAYARDIEGKQRPNPPAIGAYDVATLLREVT